MDMIVAHANDYAIGSKNRLPWNCPADMKFFVKVSKQYQNLLMGRVTASGIGQLPERKIYTLGKTADCSFKSPLDALNFAKLNPLLVCGGAMVYREFLTHTKNLYVTCIDIDVDDADSFFLPYEHLFSSCQTLDEGISNGMAYRIKKLSR